MPGSLNVIVSDNIMPTALGVTAETGWTVSNNLVVQSDAPLSANYVGNLFVNAMAGSGATLEDLKALPGGIIDQLSVGASLTHFDLQPQNPEAYILDAAGQGLNLLTHALDASHIFGPSGAIDTTGAQVAWDFGDGTTANGLVTSHSYAHSGKYDVNAVITLADGNIVTVDKVMRC